MFLFISVVGAFQMAFGGSLANLDAKNGFQDIKLGVSVVDLGECAWSISDASGGSATLNMKIHTYELGSPPKRVCALWANVQEDYFGNVVLSPETAGCALWAKFVEIDCVSRAGELAPEPVPHLRYSNVAQGNEKVSTQEPYQLVFGKNGSLLGFGVAPVGMTMNTLVSAYGRPTSQFGGGVNVGDGWCDECLYEWKGQKVVLRVDRKNGGVNKMLFLQRSYSDASRAEQLRREQEEKAKQQQRGRDTL